MSLYEHVTVHSVRYQHLICAHQGVIVAAPVYAATGSRWKAMGIATASVSCPCHQLICHQNVKGHAQHSSTLYYQMHMIYISTSITCKCRRDQALFSSVLLMQCHKCVQGLSEPLGALMALLSIRPFLTPMRLQYMLAFVGGVMVSLMHVCWLKHSCSTHIVSSRIQPYRFLHDMDTCYAYGSLPS